jgi:hypothetical protein
MTITTKEEFCDLVVLFAASNSNVVDKNNADANIAHRCYSLADALWAEREARKNGVVAAPPVPQPYTGVPIAVAGQAYPQMPNTPNGIPVAQAVPGYNAMHQVNPAAGLVQGGPQSHPYGPTVLATDMKGANMSATNPMPGMPGTGGIMSTPNGVRPTGQGEPQVLATDMRGAHLSAKNPVIAPPTGEAAVTGQMAPSMPMPNIPNSFAPPTK